jgi:hypothetical protein
MKIVVAILLSLLIVSCGVKGGLVYTEKAPEKEVIPIYINKFLYSKL